MAKEFYTVNVISHLDNETGEDNYVPTYEVRIDKGGKEKSSTARRIHLDWPSIEIIEKIEAVGAFGPRMFQISSTSRISSICVNSTGSTYTASSGSSTIPVLLFSMSLRLICSSSTSNITDIEGERKHHGRGNVH